MNKPKTHEYEINSMKITSIHLYVPVGFGTLAKNCHYFTTKE